MNLHIIAGARPNFMKIAPLVHEIVRLRASQNTDISFKLIHTGQHYDGQMSDIFFKELRIPAPDVNLEVGSAPHGVQTGRIMIDFEKICADDRPDWVVVVGDVNSSLAGALVAAKLGVNVAHVEAGLRSFDRSMPEEINRLVVDTVSNLLFTPSRDANENLNREGVPTSKIKLVGNIMIDSLVARLAEARQSDVLNKLQVSPRKFIYATLHRPANVDDPDVLRRILDCLAHIGAALPVILPLHPRTARMMENISGIRKAKGILFVEPVGYLDSLNLAENARLVITDSAGLQEETTYFRTPCLTLRPNTERPVTITTGSNKLSSPETLLHDFEEVMNKPDRFGAVPELWDGKTAERIIDVLIRGENPDSEGSV